MQSCNVLFASWTKCQQHIYTELYWTTSVFVRVSGRALITAYANCVCVDTAGMAAESLPLLYTADQFTSTACRCGDASIFFK